MRALIIAVLLLQAALTAAADKHDWKHVRANEAPSQADGFCLDADQDCDGVVRCLDETHDALHTMQAEWFQLWLGAWPTAIDWTSAVINTHVTSALMTFSDQFHDSHAARHEYAAMLGRYIDKYFAHNTAFYFGENAFALRNQAFDDMLWVVLGWLRSIAFLDSHSAAYQSRSHAAELWHGSQFVPAMAHRVIIFYDLAAKGWDTRLCGGGMNWNPSLAPYKNTITNQLFISASIGMYLYFPGDTNKAPYLAQQHNTFMESGETIADNPHNQMYLDAAITGYDWLRASNFTDVQGLYVDGFHISGWSRYNRTGSGHCDERNEMVYTYNQGVILSGLRGLWEATGHTFYLNDANELIRAVIIATGYREGGHHRATWSGLGRNGILEEHCDHTGTCSQDGQTFKGIYFEHLVQFCQPLPRESKVPGKTWAADDAVFKQHLGTCRGYYTWVKHNAEAALRTKDARGRFGMWWGEVKVSSLDEILLAENAVDYRNDPSSLTETAWSGVPRGNHGPVGAAGQFSVIDQIGLGTPFEAVQSHHSRPEELVTGDVNDRGRGRTVETQSGGLSVVRAALEFGKL